MTLSQFVETTLRKVADVVGVLRDRDRQLGRARRIRQQVNIVRRRAARRPVGLTRKGGDR